MRQKTRPLPGRTGRGRNIDRDRQDHRSENTEQAVGEQAIVDASAPSRDWVPDAVRSMAEALPFGHSMAERLLTDPRMRGVWRVLKRHPPIIEREKSLLRSSRQWRPRLANLNGYERLSSWDVEDWRFSFADQACAALFAFVVAEFNFRREVISQFEVDGMAKPWGDAAQMCRRALESDHYARTNKKIKSALTVAAKYFHDEWSLRSRSNDPYVLQRSSGLKRGHHDETRAGARAIATATRRIFGKSLYGTVATITMVALQVDGIKYRDVRNWSAD